MALDTLDKLIAGLAASQGLGNNKGYYKPSISCKAAGTFASLWKSAGNPGAGSDPGSTAGAIPDSSTTGAVLWANPSGGASSAVARMSYENTLQSTLILYDRLWHGGGFVSSSTSSQSISSPPALTRPDANGVGAELWLEVTTGWAATSTVVTWTYTNSAGTTGKTNTYTNTVSTVANQMIPLPLASGDTGIKVPQAIQFATSVASGVFNLVILRPIARIPVPANNVANQLGVFDLGLPAVYDSACIAGMLYTSTTTTGVCDATLQIIQG